MNTFTVYPAIDLLDGRVVRLKQGIRRDSKLFSLTPIQAAKKWISEGATWLHIINLDGAFGEVSEINLHTLKEVIQVGMGRALIQFGGGLRSLETLDAVLSAGVARVILGTAAVKNPELLILALKTFGSEKIILGIDAKDGFMQIEGWESNARVTPAELVERFVGEGLKTVIYTNIRHDGMQNGVDVESTKELADAFNIDVIASGGVGRLEDIKNVKSAGLSGVVVGKALYENQFSLKEAIQC